MVAVRNWEKAALGILLLAAGWAFRGSFAHYFNLDSLFYLIHYPRSWSEFAGLLARPDSAQQYRPLTMGVISLVIPHWGIDPRPYHWIPIVFHLVNTVLLFSLARRILTTSFGVLIATAFWSLHSVAAWITYDLTYISDFLLATLFLSALILAVEGVHRGSRVLIAGALVLFILSLLTKEAATTFPLALWITLTLADLRSSEAPMDKARIRASIRKFIPLTSLFLSIAVAYAAVLVHWIRAGLLYSQGGNAPYSINPWTNLWAKTTYFYWALNLPELPPTPHFTRNYLIAFGSMSMLLLGWGLDLVRRKGRLDPVEWGGLVWFAGLNVPALLLANRLAKWYLYVPLVGAALVFGVTADHIRGRLSKRNLSIVAPLILILLITPLIYSASFHARSHRTSSNDAYISDVLYSCISDFRESHASLPPQVTLYLLPVFEKNVADLLSSPPIDRGQLYELYYPQSRVTTLFAHKGDRLLTDFMHRSDTRILHYLDGHFYDVTEHFQSSARMTLFLLPTFEKRVPELLKRSPAGGSKLYSDQVEMLFADEGAQLPDDYRRRTDLWILQYINGHFNDVTEYYKTRHGNLTRRVISRIENVQASVSRDEFYPSYDTFGTPTGKPIFFPTPEKEIFTQIGGSTAIVPILPVPPGAFLRFDVSWMYDLGDGGWAELRIRTKERESILFREYLKPNPSGKGMKWQEVRLDLRQYGSQQADLILKCYNEKGKTTISDWLNWRDIAIESSETSAEKARP